jgi:NIMA (never in mitosis gene a)-related kinase
MKQDFTRTVVGTPYYLSPEMCEQKPYNEKSDIWALGCVLYQMCAGHYPFEAQSLPLLTIKIIAGRFKPIPSHYSLELTETIRQCLSVDQKRRPSVIHILDKPFIKNFIKSNGIETNAERKFEH